jgi:hypothetical protein
LLAGLLVAMMLLQLQCEERDVMNEVSDFWSVESLGILKRFSEVSGAEWSHRLLAKRQN